MSTPVEISRGGWLPVDLASGPDLTLASDGVVRWLEFGADPLGEPFLDHTMARLRAASPAAREWDSGLDAIPRAASGLAAVEPAGFVFHISRCGSTLLANALRTAPGIRVISESTVVSKLLLPSHGAGSAYLGARWDRRRRALLSALFSLYGHHPAGEAQEMVIKMASISTLSIGVVRSYWPEVPCAIVVRDPAEVVIASVRDGGGWVTLKDAPPIADAIFRFESSVAQMTMEEYCARVLGRFMRSALEAPAARSIVVDYEDLNEGKMREIACLFGMELPRDTKKLESVFGYYAKDPERRRRFEDDRKQKRALLTPEIRAASRRWAMPAYCDLRAR